MAGLPRAKQPVAPHRNFNRRIAQLLPRAAHLLFPPTLMLLACVCIAAVALGDDSPTDAPASTAVRLVRLTDDGYFKQRPVWSPNGQWLCFARHRGATIQLYLKSAADGRERRLTDREHPEYDAVFSPDGKRLAVVLDNASPNQGDLEVFTCNAEGGDLQPVAVNDGKLSHEEWPSWSPDGKRIAFTSTRDGNQELYVAGADGTDLKRLTNSAAIDAHPCWSPDGKRIAFATNRWGDLELAVIDADGGNLARLTESRGLDDYPAWSPDGLRLAFVSNRESNFEVFVASADGENPQNVSSDPGVDTYPSWTSDGRLTFVSNREGGFDIYVEEQPTRGTHSR